MFLTVLGVLVLTVTISASFLVVFGNRNVQLLSEVPLDDPAWPKLSIVIAARNEAAMVEEAVRSILSSDYPDLEVVAVDDRSEDDTGIILDRVAKDHPTLKVLHVRELPVGWLGKNHALHLGASKARGEFILFTDADIHFHSGALKKAVQHALREKLDHLSVIPELIMEGQLLPMMISYFTFCFAMKFQPWKVRDPQSSAFVGIGAFNMVRRSKYEGILGHEKIRLRPDDDLRLGQLLKRSGARADLLFSGGWIRVVWYRSFGEMFRGLEKNVFAGADYSIVNMVGLTVVTGLIHIFPFLFLFACTSMYLWVLYAASVISWCLAFLDNNRFHRLPPWTAFAVPLSASLMLVTMLHAAIKTLWIGGIRWRGTFYSLRDLKSNSVIQP